MILRVIRIDSYTIIEMIQVLPTELTGLWFPDPKSHWNTTEGLFSYEGQLRVSKEFEFENLDNLWLPCFTY